MAQRPCIARASSDGWPGLRDDVPGIDSRRGEGPPHLLFTSATPGARDLNIPCQVRCSNGSLRRSCLAACAVRVLFLKAWGPTDGIIPSGVNAI